VIDIDANVDDGLFEVIRVELLGVHLQLDERATVRIGHAQCNPGRRNGETRRLDVVVQQLEQDLHNVGVGRLAPENMFFLVHVFSCPDRSP
jgi:hypothetical protein